MIAALARIKRAVREAVSGCGGVDGAGITAGRKRSVAGDWNNLNRQSWAMCASACRTWPSAKTT